MDTDSRSRGVYIKTDGESTDTDLPQLLPPHGVADDGEHELAHVEGVLPVVVGHVTVVLTDTRQTPGHRVQGTGSINTHRVHCT